MTLDEICEAFDDKGVRGDQPLIVHQPGVGFYTIESVDVMANGDVRLTVQDDTFFESEAS